MVQVQEEWFGKQVALARELGMPLLLHCRDASARFLEILGPPSAGAPWVLHCFTGTQDELEAALAAGLYIGITGCDPWRW